MERADPAAGPDLVIGGGNINNPRAGGGGALQVNKPARRRNRMIHSCLPCRQRKIRCSKTSPSCTNCVKADRECLYIGPRLDEAGQIRLTEIKEKQGTLERQPERDVARSGGGAGGNLLARQQQQKQRIVADEVGDDDDDDDGYGYDRDDLESTPLVALDLTYEDDADGLSDMIDLGIQIGKMRITERIGGLSRPRISEEISATISSQRPPPGPDTQQGGQQPPVFDNMSDGGVSDIGDQPSSVQFLPYRAAADRLMAQYFTAVHTVAPCSHRPSLESTYASFWEEIHAGFEPRPSMQAIIFAALFSGIVSMDENIVPALCRAEISRAHSVLVGAAVRMAECMGLHRDGEEYGLTPLETHVRRIMWYQLCFLDVRTCEAQGPRPVIRREDYDTRLPLNCDEAELTQHSAAAGPPASADRWTTSTLPLIRFEINEMMRIIWLDRRKLETRKTTLTAVLTKVEDFRQRLSAKYDGLLDVREPAQCYAKCVMYLLTYRLHVMVLHPYHLNAGGSPPPPRLSQLLITSGIMVLELAVQLETSPDFAAWAWYLGAYSQYQPALLLAAEVFYRPRTHGAERIWPCLDYVFGLDPRLPRAARALQILAEVQERTAVHMRMRRMRGPLHISRSVPAQNAVAGIGKAAASPTPPPRKQQQLQQQGGQPPLHISADGNTKPEPAYAAPPPPPLHTPSTVGPPFQSQIVFPGLSDGQGLWNLPLRHGTANGGDRPTGIGPAAVGSMGQGNRDSNINTHSTIVDTIDWARDIHVLHSLPQFPSSSPQAQRGSEDTVVMLTSSSFYNFQDTVNSLFPADPQNGGLSVQGFHDLNPGVPDWRG
ncbi:hypothetical protein DL764_003014 [Monosporascus ibericus]|uniref:Zn(2)-C6 fungal-type domain-containing protein n=1 Tax=Monosporascus ibericus TaxID=155417 RepID=A0A4Q4TK26_9PEZI|nr:hypothetical protein DL764_003014 [Monosporascus ibericus]